MVDAPNPHVRISHPVTHDGRTYEVGTVVALPLRVARHFIEAGVGVYTDSPDAPRPRQVFPWSGETQRKTNAHGIRKYGAMVMRQAGDTIRGGMGVNLKGPVRGGTPLTATLTFENSAGDTGPLIVGSIGTLRRRGPHVEAVLINSASEAIPLGLRPNRTVTVTGWQGNTVVPISITSTGVISAPSGVTGWRVENQGWWTDNAWPL